MESQDRDGTVMQSGEATTTAVRESYLRRLGQRRLSWIILAAVAVLFFATFPLYYDVANKELGILFLLVFIYGVVAQGWNLVAGYTGQISLGQNAFFGIGAYTVALLWFYNVTHTGYWFDPLLMLMAFIAPAILAVLVGLPLLSRLRGDYFAFGTLGLGVIVKVLFLNGGFFTGGSEGKLLIKVMPEGVTFNLRTHYYAGLLVAIIATLIVYLMTSSRIGLALKAIREDEVSAASHGINILKYKIISFAVAAALAGLAGSVYVYYLLHPMPMNVFDMSWLFVPIVMVVLGGTGTILGPWLGALVVYGITWYGGKYFPGWHPVILGVIMILVMLFLPSGLMGAGENINHLVFRRGSRAR
jgi:branched-chain amino acid transport system permease protein